MKTSILLVIAALPAAMFAQAPAGYYSGLDGKCGAELKEAAMQAASSLKTVSYGSGTWNAFRTTDVHVVNGVECWFDMYSNNNVPVTTTNGLNIEHSVPNSWWGGIKNDAYKDLYHLNPSNKDANGRKNYYPLGIVADQTWSNGVTTVGHPAAGASGGSKMVFEPADEYKGDFARAYMYIFTIYANIPWKYDMSDRNYMFVDDALTLRPWAQTLLLEWARQDPVSQREIDRNEAVYRIQHNRNPFIDNPELAEHIWGSKSNEPFHVEGGGDTPQPTVRTIYEASLTKGNLSDFTFENTVLPEQLTYVWSVDSKYGLKASSYTNNTCYEADATAISPVIDLTGYKSATLSYSQAANHFKSNDNFENMTQLLVREENGEWQSVTRPASGVGSSWTFSPSGDIDLTAMAGKKMQFGYRYTSTSAVAGTWEIDKIIVKGEKKDSGIGAVELPKLDFDASTPGQLSIYNPGEHSYYIYDTAGCLVISGTLRGETTLQLPRGLYIIATDGTRPAKALVR